MTGRSWVPGCPVSLDDLRKVTVAYKTPTGSKKQGALILHKAIATDAVNIFGDLYAMGYPIASMKPIDDYYNGTRSGTFADQGSDGRSINANNTSAFNCRAASTSSNKTDPNNSGFSWSLHASGRAIDLNPLYNPYTSNNKASVSREISNKFDSVAERQATREKQVIKPNSPIVTAFESRGWAWLVKFDSSGNLSTTQDQDYQHFDKKTGSSAPPGAGNGSGGSGRPGGTASSSP
jgi:hypothetical protein